MVAGVAVAVRVAVAVVVVVFSITIIHNSQRACCVLFHAVWKNKWKQNTTTITTAATTWTECHIYHRHTACGVFRPPWQ